MKPENDVLKLRIKVLKPPLTDCCISASDWNSWRTSSADPHLT